MSKISEQAADAFVNNYSYKNNNTEVIICAGNITRLFLHRNLIAEKDDKGTRITTCGWNTSTTKSRLNALPGVYVTTIKGELYLNDKFWDGEWITI